MSSSIQTKIGQWILTVPVVVFGVLEIYGVHHHVEDGGWPAHASFHAVTGLFNLVAVGIFSVVMTWRFLKEGHAWAWWGLVVVGIAVFAGLPAGNILSGGGLSGGESLGNPELFKALAWAAPVVWAVGLFLAKPLVKKATS